MLRRAAIDAEIERLITVFYSAPVENREWLRRRIDMLMAARDAEAEMAPEACEDAPEPDLADVAPWAREMVREHLDRKAAERRAAKRQAAVEAYREHEEAITAHRRAALSAPMMPHMGNRPGENFRLRDPRRATAAFSTPEERHAGHLTRLRAAEAAKPVGNVVHVPAAPENAAPIPCCDLRPPRDKAPWTDLTAAMP